MSLIINPENLTYIQWDAETFIVLDIVLDKHDMARMSEQSKVNMIDYSTAVDLAINSNTEFKLVLAGIHLDYNILTNDVSIPKYILETESREEVLATLRNLKLLEE